MKIKEKYSVEDLLEIVRLLRGENGCPWDKVQTHESIKKDLLEEAYEAVDALDNKDDAMFANELGDVLLQVAFHSVMAEERNAFNFERVLKEICDKLITRHTHVFGDVKAENAEEALKVWERNKKKEKGQNNYSEMIKDIPKGMSALMSAEKIQKKAKKCGFDWQERADVFKKVKEEFDELEEAVKSGNKENIDDELGDCFFSLVNYSRFLDVNPETALLKSNSKFVKRFCEMERIAKSQNKELDQMSLEEMDELWEQAKKNNKNY